jgi:hypothetical protein
MTHDGDCFVFVADAPLPWIETDASLGNLSSLAALLPSNFLCSGFGSDVAHRLAALSLSFSQTRPLH